MTALKLQCQNIQRPLHVFNKTLGGGRGADVNQELKVLYNNNNKKYAGEAVGRVTVNQELKV